MKLLQKNGKSNIKTVTSNIMFLLHTFFIFMDHPELSISSQASMSFEFPKMILMSLQRFLFQIPDNYIIHT